jgi:hypothetical protein
MKRRDKAARMEIGYDKFLMLRVKKRWAGKSCGKTHIKGIITSEPINQLIRKNSESLLAI